MSSRGFNHNSCFICFKSPFKNPGISLHRFPTCAKQRLVWLKACKLTEDDYLSSRRVCSDHFDKNCFNTSHVRKSLKYGSVPTIFPDEDLEHSMLERKSEEEKRLSIENSMIEKESEDDNKISSECSRLRRKSENEKKISLEGSKLKRKSEDKNGISIKHSSLKRVPEDQNGMSIDHSRPQRESKEENLKSVVTIEVSSTEEESANEKESSHEEESSNEEQVLFCPNTMVRYDNAFNAYSTQWVCRKCLSVMLSEDAVHKHLKIQCEYRTIPSLGPNNEHNDDNVENNNDSVSNNEDCDESNKKDGNGNKEDDDDDDDDDNDVEVDDSDDDYHEDDEDDDDEEDEDEDDEINDPCELIDLVKTS